MLKNIYEDVTKIVKEFKISGSVQSMESVKSGNINSGYVVYMDNGKKYSLQVINKNVFKDIKSLMNNIELVTNHLISKGIKTLIIIPTKANNSYLEYEEEYIRLYEYIDDVLCFDKATDKEKLKETSKSFAEFTLGLNDFDTSKIVDTISDFHNTEKRYKDFLKAVDADVKGRRKEVTDEINFIKYFKDEYSIITNCLSQGKIPSRITHNDTKISNILFSKDKNNSNVVIDLDTVMQGSFLYDYGDAIRSSCSSAEEDETNLNNVYLNIDFFKGLTEGYLEVLGKDLNKYEIMHMVTSVKLMTLELAMRFLTDYLKGDVYFKILYPTHNLDKARNQIHLAKDIIKNHHKLKKIIKDIMQN